MNEEESGFKVPSPYPSYQLDVGSFVNNLSIYFWERHCNLSLSKKNNNHVAEAYGNTDSLCIFKVASLSRTHFLVTFLDHKCHQLRHIVCSLGSTALRVPASPMFGLWASGLSYLDYLMLIITNPTSHFLTATYPFHNFCWRCGGDLSLLPLLMYFTFLIPVPVLFLPSLFLPSSAVCWWATALSFSEEGRGIMLSPNSGRLALSCL